MSENVIGRLVGREFRFRSYNYPNKAIRHRGFDLWVLDCKTVELEGLDNRFIIVPGLSGVGISFKSQNYPDRFLRHSNSVCHIDRYEDNVSYKADASWIPSAGLAGGAGYSFEASNWRGEYMRHENFRLRKAQRDGSDQFNQDATWLPEQVTDVKTSGEWKLVYGNDNAAAAWEWNQEIAVGLDLSNTTSVTQVDQVAWKVGMQGSGLAFGDSIKAMFEVSGMHSVTNMSSQTWTSSHHEKTTKKYSGDKGAGFYLWQWHLYATTSDNVVIAVASDIFQETSTNNQPQVPS